jgi:soluble lytic murein transglycosylase
VSNTGALFVMRRCALAFRHLSFYGTYFLLAVFAAHGAAVSRHASAKHSGSVHATLKAMGGAGLIALAQHELTIGNYGLAAEYAATASTKTPVLDDYAQYIRAQAEYALKNYAEVMKAATHVFKQTPVSPFTGPAAALAVQASLDADHPKEALDLIKKYFDRIPQLQADLLLARSFAATGDLAQAAEYGQRVYYGYPMAKEATDAANDLANWKQRLGDAYPPPMPAAMLSRAEKLFQANQPDAARIELAAAIPQLAGPQRDLARVRLGEADFYAGHTQAAFEYFSALKVDDPEADAERLDYLIRCARRLDRHADVKPFLDQLEQKHPTSPWRLDALVSIADQARVDNEPNVYLPLYRACAETFANDPRAAWCHWRVAFDSYLKDAEDAYDLLRKQIQQYPDSPDANDALYFLGRLLQRKQDPASARACYEELLAHFPNTYYSVLARERLKEPAIEVATPNPQMVEFFQSVKWPARPQFPSFTPGEIAGQRLTRAHLLEGAGLNDFAEGELKFGAKEDGEQQNVYAYELAKMAATHNQPDRAMRFIKAYAPGYMYMPLDEAPVEFWKLAFPLPYRASIEMYSRRQGLDPYLVAALIRQESEFNTHVISHANAYGLMQVLPATGRQLARRLGVRRYRAAQLLLPDRNIQFGTYFFRNLMDSYKGDDGQVALALASYNAGPSRANLWRTWGPFREPAEFIESVPFHETRSYIQLVLRNADIYRRLYASAIPDVPTYRAKPAPKTRKRHRVRSSA